MTLQNGMVLSLRASVCLFTATTVATMAANSVDGAAAASECQLQNQKVLEHVRRPTATTTPAWVNAIPGRIAESLVEKHEFKDGEHWGLAKASPGQALPFDEVGSARFVGLVNQYNLFDKVGRPNDATRAKSLRYWQSWQDAKTGRFKDPRDAKRVVNEKYVVGVIRGLGGEPLHPWSATSDSGKVETKLFLKRAKSDPDWAQGGWGVGSHTGLQACQIFDAINEGQTRFIPDLEKGLEQILSHQNPADGLWGPASADLANRIGGTLKVVGRLYFHMGMRVPHTRELAESLIQHSRNGDWFKHGQSSCVPRNVAEVTAYCIEASDYRRAELLQVMDKLADDYRSWVFSDGRTLFKRGDTNSVGLEFVTMYGLGVVGAYLNWEDCRLPNPLAHVRRGQGYRYQPKLTANGRVTIVDSEVARKQEEKAARKWILDLPKHARKWLATVEHKPQPGEPWGLFTFSADSKIPYSIPSTRIAWYYAYLCGGIEKMPGYHRKAKAEMAAWLQKHQDAKSHQFIDPLLESCVPNIDDPKVRYTFREAVSKYAMSLLDDCGAKPLYPYTPGANEEGEIDPEHYLKFIKAGDWENRAWGIGSHAALQTVHLFELVNKGRTDLIPTLIEGTEFIVSKQNPRTGMWGADNADLCQQIGGAVKVIGRFQWYMGMVSPHMDKLADSLIANYRSGAFYVNDGSPCVPRNVAEMVYACLEASDYRREELREVLVGQIRELKRYTRADGSFSETWGGTNSVGWCQSVVSPKAGKPRADLVGTQLVMDTLTRIYDRAGWKGGTWEKPKYWRTAINEANNTYEISCDARGKVSVTQRKPEK